MLEELMRLVPERELDSVEVAAAAEALLTTQQDDRAKASFLRAWAQRRETAAELAACAEALLPRAADPGVRGAYHGKPLLDCCGTGGGGLNLLNISTGLMFVLAAVGVPVVKHGNRGITKKSGSADVLEALGLRIDLPAGDVPRCLEKVGCAFLFAPAYHTGFAAVATVRRALAAEGQRTVFNLLGPLLNPARPEARLVGVFKVEHVPLYAETLDILRAPRFTVACGEDAATGTRLGEISAHGQTLLRSTLREANGAFIPNLTRTAATPEKLETLLVASATQSAARLEAILAGHEKGLGRELLLINAAVSAWTQGAAASLEDGLALCTEALDSGAALAILRRWQVFSRQS